MHIIKENEEQGYLSDSTLTCSSTSVDLLCKRPQSGRNRELDDFEKLDDFDQQSPSLHKSTHATRKYTKTAPKGHSSFRVGRKPSLVQFLEKQSLFRKKQQKLSNHSQCLPLNARSDKKLKTLFRDESPNSGYRESGDFITRNNQLNQAHIIYPALVQQNCKRDTLSGQTFPFRSTPSGNYKLKPSQVIYESKNLSIVAADPKNVMMNVTESNKTKEPGSAKKPENENWDTTCLYSAVDTEGKIPFGSEFSDTVSESDGGGLFTNGKSTGKPSELNLTKMGYVMDNCIEWKKLNLPKKSELQKLLMHNILNMINPDIQIKIGTSTYNCHRIVLLCYCTYFSSKTGQLVELPETSVLKEVFSLIYQWMLHLGADSYRLLRRDNILSVFRAAQFLGIKELENQCWAFIDNMEIFNEDKAFLLYLEARRQDNKDIMELMVPRIQRFFLTLVSSKEFVEFSSEEVCTFLRSNYICIHCEMEVFMAGVRWLSHDWQARKQHIVEVMKCVRFGFINPKVLITMKRNPQSPEFLRIANIPEVSNLIDDGVALLTLRSYLENECGEDVNTTLKSLGLANPVPRNWAGTTKNYQSYHEFLQDLGHYRSKQRLEIKRSKMKVDLESVADNDFLSSAVLPPVTEQKIKKMHKGSLMRCLPQLEPKELDLLKKMICQDELATEDKSRQMKSKLYSMAEEEYRQTPSKKPCSPKSKNRTKRTRRDTPVNLEEQDIAARKIQKAYRGYSKKKSKSNTDTAYQEVRNSLETSKQWKSRSDPSLPSSLLKSSTHPAEKCEENSLPLQPSRNTVFVFGGSNPFEASHSENNGQKIFKYHIKSNSWKKCGGMPEPRHFHSVLFFLGKIYVAGGKNPSMMLQEHGGVSRKVWRFDPHYKAWSRIKDMHHARRSFGLVACNNKMFAIGGRDEHDRVLDSVERYDMETESWTIVRSLNVARAGAACCEFKGRIWVAGGMINESDMATNGVEYYNYHQNIWVQCAALRYTVAYGTLVPIRDRLYLVGGALGLLGSELSGSGKHIDLWDQESQTWCLASMMSKPRHAHAAVYLRGASSCELGQLFILGGMSTKHNSVMDSVECWREQDDHWIQGVSPLPHPLSGHAAVSLPTSSLG